MTFKDNIDINNNNLTEAIINEERINYLLDALNNTVKYEALPNGIKIKLEPYRNKVQNGESLTIDDYKKIKEAIM